MTIQCLLLIQSRYKMESGSLVFDNSFEIIRTPRNLSARQSDNVIMHKFQRQSQRGSRYTVHSKEMAGSPNLPRFRRVN